MTRAQSDGESFGTKPFGEQPQPMTILEVPIHGQVIKCRLDLNAPSQRLIFDNSQGGLLYEFPSVLALNQHLKPGDTFIDVGAHVGFFTLIASVMVGQTGRVLAFEPEPRNAESLRQNLALNRTQNVTLINLSRATRSRSGKTSL